MQPEVNAHGIRVGQARLAFDFACAREVIEQFSLVAIPRAPAWMPGAANLNGLVTPVFDLRHHWNDEESPRADTASSNRLLLCGDTREGGTCVFAFMFQGLPEQVSGRPSVDLPQNDLPDVVVGSLRGQLRNGHGDRFALLDFTRFIARLSQDLTP